MGGKNRTTGASDGFSRIRLPSVHRESPGSSSPLTPEHADTADRFFQIPPAGVNVVASDPALDPDETATTGSQAGSYPQEKCWFVQLGKKQHRLAPDETIT